jgi:hypothetical protein
MADELRGLVGSAETVAFLKRESEGELVPINAATVNNLDAG